MASGKLGALEYKLNNKFQHLQKLLLGSHPNTNLLHPQWIMDYKLLNFAKEKLQKFPKGTSVLDVGCGDGPYWNLNKELNWTGIDIYSTEKTNYLINKDGTYPIREESFDIVICTQVIEHVSNFDLLASEVFRVLKPGGTLILNAPFLYPFHGMPHDEFRYTTSSLTRIFNKFEISEIGTLGGIGSTIATLINNFWQYFFASNWKLKIIGIMTWPVSIINNFFWNLLSLPLDLIDRTNSFPLNTYLIARKPINTAKVEI